MIHSIGTAASEHWQPHQFTARLRNLQMRKKPVEEKKWMILLVNMPEKKRLHPPFPHQLQCLKPMASKEIIPIQVSISMAPTLVLQICQKVALVAIGAAFTDQTISMGAPQAVTYMAHQTITMGLRQAVTCTVVPQVLISMSLHIAERVNMIFKQISRLILNLFMNQLPHPGNKNT